MDSHTLRIVEPSEAFLTTLQRLGLADTLLKEGEAE